MHLIWYFLLLLLGTILLAAAVYVWFMPNPDQSACDKNPATGQPFPPDWSRPDCLYLNMGYADPSIPTPTPALYLGDFAYSQGAGPALLYPMWYAFRYIRESDGGYGPLSEWTTLPIYAGAETLPCYPPVGGSSSKGSSSDDCSSDGIPTGYATVTFNEPVLVTTVPLDLTIADGYYAIVYRYIGNDSPAPNPSILGTPVGYLIPIESNTHGWTSYFLDVAYNPLSSQS